MKMGHKPAGVTQVYTSIEELLALKHAGNDSLPQVPSLLSHFQQTGAVRSRLRGQGIEFEEVRPYTQGDDIRSIDWRLSARTGKPLTKIYTEERDQPLFVIVDQRSAMFFGSTAEFKSVVAAHLAAAFCWQAYKQKTQLGGLIIGDYLHLVKTQRSQQSLFSVLSEVARANNQLSAQSQSNLSLTNALIKCRNSLPSGVRVILISDFHDFDDICAATLIALSKRRQLQLVKVSDSAEESITTSGVVGISDGNSSHTVRLSKRTAELYQQQWQQRQTALQTCATQCHAQLHCLNEKQLPGNS